MAAIGPAHRRESQSISRIASLFEHVEESAANDTSAAHGGGGGAVAACDVRADRFASLSGHLSAAAATDDVAAPSAPKSSFCKGPWA